MGKTSLSLSISVLLVISVLWKPAYTDDKCSVGCKGTPTGATFLTGHKYNYGVDGTVAIYLSTGDKQETSVKLAGQVSVSALGNCAYVLKVKDLFIQGPDGKKYGKPKGLEKPVRFTLQDGRLGPEICTETDDTRRSLNIKRAIISLLQTEQKSSTQYDVFGVCPTDVSSSQEGGSVLLHRSRDLAHCAHREQSNTGLVNAVFNPDAEIKSTLVLQSIWNVESKVLNGVPAKVAANEEYLYKPFSVGENGARARVLTKLNLVNNEPGADAGHFTESRTIMFEAPHGVKMEQSNLQAALASVKETANTLTTQASSTSAGYFAELIRVLRSTSKQDLLNIYTQVKSKVLDRRVFLDALFRLGTGPSVAASVELYKTNQLQPLEQPLALLSLANARHVDNDALNAAASLLDLQQQPKEIYLGVGALAGAYCKDHDCHDSKVAGIVTISQKLGAKLQNCKPKTKIEEDQVVAVLKGIRNIRHLEDSLIDKLVHCAVDNTVKPRVRVAILEAFQADPCSAKVKKTGIDVMKNRQLDSEIRIKAYLSVIACPCGKSANEIKNLLDSEPVHQVGRFITTSLRHIRSSANPDKALARQHYGLIRTPRKFNVDDRKYSFYREGSYDIDALGMGGIVEETVIYSQDSFLPRSASLNLTAEVFGHSLNVFEVGARQGNLDRFVEHFLGPKSFLRTDSPQSIYDNLVKRYQETKEKVDKTRGRRSIKTDVDTFDKRFKEESIQYNNELDLDIYIKLFGTDAVFLSLGDDKGFDFNKALDHLLGFCNEGMNKLKNFKQELRSHLLFLDAELVYPTSTGLPLKLDLIGAMTGRLNVAANVDIRQILRNPETAKVDINLAPSTDIEITGLFLIDADSVTTGLKVTSNLHTSTGGHIIAKVLENGNGFDLQFIMPVEKQEILVANSDLVFVTVEKGQKSKQIPVKQAAPQKDYNACFDQLSRYVGLTLCTEASFPSKNNEQDSQGLAAFLARYPLTGPVKLKVILEHGQINGYHIKGIIRDAHSRNGAQYSPMRSTFELLFEAEGKADKYGAVFTGELVNEDQEQTIKAGFEIKNKDKPVVQYGGQISLYNKPSEFYLLVKAYSPNKESESYVKAGFNIQGNERRSVYTPVIEFKRPADAQKQSLTVDGHFVKEIIAPQNVKYSIENIHIKLPDSNEVVDINGHLTVKTNDASLDLKAKTKDHSLSLTGSVVGHDVKLEFHNTLNPYVNFRLTGHFETGETLRNELDIYYGGDLRNNQQRVLLSQLLKYHKNSADDFSLHTDNKFEIYAIPFLLKANAEVDPKKVDIELGYQYVDKKMSFDLDGRTNSKKPGDYSVKVDFDVDKEGFEVLSKRDIVTPDKSNFENYILIKGYGKHELSGVVLHRMQQNDVNVGVNGQYKATIGSKTEAIKFDFGAVETEKSYSSHAKIDNSGGNVLDYLLKINGGPTANGELKFVLKDTIAANGQFKVSEADGKGNGFVLVDFKKTQRKIKADVSYILKDPTYNADVDIFLNFDKDKSDKIHYSTKSKRTENLIDSKNSLEYAGTKSELNLYQDGLTTPEKSHSFVEVVLPTGRCLSLKVDNDMTVQQEVLNGHAEVVLSDAPTKGEAASTISYQAKFVNVNWDKQSIERHEGQLDIKLKDGKYLQNKFYVKNIPEGSRAKFELKSDLTGNLIPQPASLQASSEYSTEESIIDGFENYRLKGNYGSDMNFEYVGKTEVNVMSEKDDKKYRDDSTLTLRLPFEKAHDIKIVSNVLFVDPVREDVLSEYTIVESVSINSDVYKLDANGKLGIDSGYAKFKVLVPHVDPVSFDVNYKADLKSEKQSGKLDMKTTYGKGKNAMLSVEASETAQEYDMKLLLVAPEKIADIGQKLALEYHAKNPTPDSFNFHTMAYIDDKLSCKSEAQFIFSKANPLIDLKYTMTGANPSRIYVKGTSLSSTQGKVDLELENIHELSLVASSEGSIQQDNIVYKFDGNSEKLGLKNYHLEVSTKGAGSGTRLEFQATNDNKNILSGSTSLISKQEGQKTIIEGSGSVKVRDEQKSTTFKYIRTLLTEGNEQGVDTFLNLAVGERSYVAESRVTNLEYKYSYVYCEEKKQCANAEIHSKINMQNPDAIQHTLNIGMDLRKLGVTPEFGFESHSELSKNKLPQYSMDLHVNKDEKKYHLHAYSKPKFGDITEGITITLPQRVVALESRLTYPTEKTLPFPLKGEVAFYLDKNKPQTKTGMRFLVDMNGDSRKQTGVAEFSYSHPKIGKEVLLRFDGQYQNPSENTFKIESKAALSHPSLGRDRESKLLFEVSPTHSKLLVATPLVQVVDVESNVVLKDTLQQGDFKFSVLEGKPVQVRAVVKDFQYYEFTTGYSEDSQRKLSIIGHLEPEKRVDVSADIILPGQKKNIIYGALYLQDNLVKSDYGISKENFNYFVNSLKTDLNNLEGRIKQLGEKANEDFKNTMKRVESQMLQVQKAYSEELNKLYKELADEELMKEISEIFHQINVFLAKMTVALNDAFEPIVQKFLDTIKVISQKVEEMYEKQIEPQLKQLTENLANFIKEYLDGLIDLVAHFAALFTEFFEKHKPELQELTNTMSEIFKDMTRIVVAQLKQVRTKLTQLVTDITQQIKEMPLIAMLQERFQELAVPDQVIAVLQQVHSTFRELLPTEETKAFADALFNYIQKKLHTDRPVDDNAELRVIYEKLSAAIMSLVQLVRAQLNELGVQNVANVKPDNFFLSPQSYSGLPTNGDASFSALEQLIKGDLPDPLAVLRAYRLRSVNPLDEVPSKLRATVVNGQHIFSFDGRHLTFPGTCRYILAHDFVDRNFSFVMQLQNGQPKGLALIDKSGQFVELKDNGLVTYNGATHGYPVIENDIFAFKTTRGILGIGTRYGAMAFCTSKLEVCYFEISGFYLGKLRGLLGDGNNEPFDDFAMPNGKISTSESEFANAYRLATSCAIVKTQEHSSQQFHASLPAACEQVFGGSSPLRTLSLVLDAAPFRQACIHAVTANGKDSLQQACDLGRGYAALALSGMLPAVMPAACLRCTDVEGQPKELGDTYEVKLPNKQADIVVTVETTKMNAKNYKDIAIPLVAQLISTLKSKHIDDIKIYLVGISPKYPYPILYDSDLKLNPKVHFDDESRYQVTPTVVTGNAQIDGYEQFFVSLFDGLRDYFGLTNVIASYESVMDLPLRPGAVKHAINIVGQECKEQNLLLEFVRNVAFDIYLSEVGYTHTLVTVTPELTLGGGKNVAQVVGFTEHKVIMLGDKNMGQDAEELRHLLEVEDDSCIDFVEGTNDGIVLSATNFHAMNAGQQKQFLQTAVNAITRQMLDESLVQNCMCQYVDPFKLRSVCVTSERKAVAA